MRMVDAEAIQYEPMLSAKGNGMYEDVMVAYKSQIDDLPTIEERKTGKWEERKVSTEKVIDEWQSCKCSVCGRYDTRPYLYYFDEPRFCSWCGSDMRA